MKLMDKMRKSSKKDIGRVVAGISLIVLVLILNGFLSFITMKFDISKLTTSGYWANFALLTVSEMAVMLGMYIIQKSKDLKATKITELQENIKEQREVVYETNKVMEAEEWLREVLNYQERLLIFEKIVRNHFETLKLEEPREHDKHYKKKKKKFDKQQETKQFLCKQKEYIKKDRQRVQFLIEGNKEECEKLSKELEQAEDYAFKTTKIKHKDICWCNLLSDINGGETRDASVFFSEKTELTKKIVQYVAVGSITSAFLACLIYPQFVQVGWSAVLSSLITFCVLIVFMLRGISLSNDIILRKYYTSLEKRKSIYIKMLSDLKLSNVIIEKEKKEEG